MALNIVEKIDDAVRIQRVLLSVADKSGLDTFVPALLEINPDILFYSTGGTYSAIQAMLGDEASKKNLIQVSDYTGQPEMQGGLVKTLDFKIYLGLLSETYNQAHVDDMARVEAQAIDMVVVNLYPFKQTVARDGVTPEEARTNIDIGGPCMVRASAKNYLRVASVTDPADYPCLLDELKESGGSLGLATRLSLMKKSFAHTADYDAAIAAFFAGQSDDAVRSIYSIQN
jgi:phosphoribosylaminoimidazolecarboxamide formyltransferase/IMP cyclohydrolase